MLEFYNIDDINISFDTCITIGNFDGVHRGHQTLIKNTVDFAKERGLKSVVFTFSNHPVNYFRPNSVKNIVTVEEKREIIKELGVDVFVSIPFDSSMTEISTHDYVKNILIDKIHAKHLVIGHDFRFARNREGNPLVLKEISSKYGCSVEVVDPVKLNDRRISSTDIRKYISEGNMVEANYLLGRNYFMEGEVIYGRQIGRKLGFRTANIYICPDSLVPGIGIYSSYVTLDDKKYLGATSVGTNPTVNGTKLSLEVHILDFDKDIYGKEIKIEFVEKIRDEEVFASLEELKEQLALDVENVRNLLG